MSNRKFTAGLDALQALFDDSKWISARYSAQEVVAAGAFDDLVEAAHYLATARRALQAFSDERWLVAQAEVCAECGHTRQHHSMSCQATIGHPGPVTQCPCRLFRDLAA